MNKESGDKKIRQSQALFPFGVGAILNQEGQSFIACDTSMWRHGDVIHEPRLEKHLRVAKFKAPPRAEDRRSRVGVPFARFPRWLFCSNCRKMHQFSRDDETGKRPECKNCGNGLTPMRFVVACEDGHLGDVPWQYWAHRNSGKDCRDFENLEFRANTTGGGSLASLVVKCQSCGSSNNLMELMQPRNFRCPGFHPWQRRNEKIDCNATVRVVQRGASNLRYDYTVEAVSIPPWSDYDFWGQDEEKIHQHEDFQTLASSIDMPPLFEMLCDKIADSLGLESAKVERVAMADAGKDDVGSPATDSSIEYEEYEALTAADVKHHPKDLFQKTSIDLDSFLESGDYSPDRKKLYTELRPYLKSVSVVSRLRCIRILTGFSRINRSTENIVPVNIGSKNMDWLPGIEVFGEGVFIELDSEQIDNWAGPSESAGEQHARRIIGRFGNIDPGVQESFGGSTKFNPSAKFIMLHTLAHILMLRMQFYAGYSTSSIRERVYCDSPGSDEETMSGILLFTSAGDVEGSMGGLARMGQPDTLFPLILEALDEATRCSRDPICIESPGQGIDSLNLAACHSCCLVPETSCQYRNQFLDRALVVGNSKRPEVGFFTRIVELLDEL
jgi:hypothetical protein